MFFTCSNSDDGIDCSLYDPAFPALYVRIVDETGTNLIENGTIDPVYISVEGDFLNAGFRFVPPNEFANPDAEIRELDNSLNLTIPHSSTFQYTIHLNEMDPIKVDFTAELKRIACDLSYFLPIEAIINNQSLVIKEIAPLQVLAIITL